MVKGYDVWGTEVPTEIQERSCMGVTKYFSCGSANAATTPLSQMTFILMKTGN